MGFLTAFAAGGRRPTPSSATARRAALVSAAPGYRDGMEDTERRDDDEQSTVGKVKEAVGWATGDRTVEAEGRVDASEDEEPGAVQEATEEVRREHGDTAGR